MQVVAIETTIGLFLLERKHTINLSFNLLYCCKVHTNAAAQVQIHYTLLRHCPPKSPSQIHFWKRLLEGKFGFHGFSCWPVCLGWEQGWSGKEDPFPHHSSHTSLPCQQDTLDPLGQSPSALEPKHLSGLGWGWFALSSWKDFILMLLSHPPGIINAGLGSFI